MSERPYAPSWIDRLIAWIERIRVPAVVFYVLLYMAGFVLYGGAWWWGEIDWADPALTMAYSAVWAILPLGLIHLLDRVAARSFERFRVLLPEELADDFEYRFTTMPARTVFWTHGVAVLLLSMAVVFTPDILSGGETDLAPRLVGGIGFVWSYSMAPILAYSLVRHLALVRRAFTAVPRVDARRQQPLYALSRLPFYWGVALLLINALSFVDPAGGSRADTQKFVDLAAAVPFFILAGAAFIVPVLGMHYRLRAAREDLLDDNGRHLELAQTHLYEAVQGRDDAAVGAADKAIGSLFRVREELGKIRTWPWSPGTVRSFLSAVTIPMIVWALQAFGDRIF